MLDYLIRVALRNRLLVLMIAIAVMGIGAYQAVKLPVEVLPDLTKPRVTIMTEVPGKAPEEVESYVTIPLEKAINGIQGVTRIQSTTDVGLSLIFVEFDWGTDIYQARQFVQERIRTVAMEPGVEPYLTPVASLMGEVMLIGVTSPNDTISPRDLRSFTDWDLRRRIQKISGVAEALSMGGGIQQVVIQPKPEKLLAYGISVREINEAASESASNATGGYTTSRSREQMIRILAMTTDLEEIKKTVVKKVGDRTITLADVANVTWDVMPQRGEAGVNGVPGVILSVVKSPGVDTRVLTKKIEEVLADATKEFALVDRDIELTPLFRQATFIDAAMTNLEEAMTDGAMMVVIVLFVFLFSLRSILTSFLTVFITLMAIPLSFAVTILIFTLMDISVNSMTLGGLAVAIGIVVDDAIVDLENVLRRLKENASKANPKPRLEVIAKASGEVRNSIFYATIFIILVFVPLLILTGVAGKLFTPIAIATIASMIASFVVSLTVIPVLCSLFLRPKENVEHKDGIIIAILKKGLEYSFMKAALRVPTLTISFGLILLTYCVFQFNKMPKEFLPNFKEETLIVAMTTAPGTSLDTTHELALMVDKIILNVEGVQTVGHRAGRAERGDHVVPVSTVEFDIELDHRVDRSRREIEGEIKRKMKEIPGVFAAISGPLTDRMGHMLSGVPAKVAIKISGRDLTELRSLGEKIQKLCQDIPGLEEAKLAQQAMIPQLQIRFDRDKGEVYGINAKSFNDQIHSQLNGEFLLELYQGEQVINLVSRMPYEIRQSERSIRNLYVETINHRMIQVFQVADLINAKGPNVINRENSERVFTVSINPTIRDLPKVVGELERRIDEQFPEYVSRISVEGEYIAQQKAAKDITIWSIIILLTVTVLLFSYFGSMNFALQVITDIPLSLIGAILFTQFMMVPISIASLVGFIAVAGISARNSIMLISHYIMLMRDEDLAFGKDLIIRGTKERLLPVLMTAFSAGIALIPLVLATGESGKEILSPVAIAITGGLISSTILGLAITPAVFYLFGRKACDRALKRKINL